MLKFIVIFSWLYCLAHIFIGLPTEYIAVRLGNGIFSTIWVLSIVSILHTTFKRKQKKQLPSV